MVDGGLHLEPQRRLVVNQLRRLAPEHWTKEQINWLDCEEGGNDSDGLPRKLIFGSDYPYREAERHLALSNARVELKPSFAVGGLSSVWGAAMLPYCEHDIADWPVTVKDLNQHYKSVIGLTGLCAAHDDLSEVFPLFTDAPGCLELSRQASTMWNTICKNRNKLLATGIRCGHARLAFSSPNRQNSGCLYCGMCLSGCPYSVIYNSEQSVATFRSDQNFSYEPNIIVAEMQESLDAVVVRGYHRLTLNAIEFKVNRLYLASGVIPTSGILLRSRSDYGRPVMLADSQYFLFPGVLTTRVGDVRGKRNHALSQLFVEIFDPHVSPFGVHLQVYSYNSLIGRTLQRALGPLAGSWLHREIECRLMVFQGFLHSNQSGKIALTLHRHAASDRIELRGVINDETTGVVRKVVRKIFKNGLRLGVVPISTFLKLTRLGRGYHVGGAFPMRKRPGKFDSDVLGRPTDWRRVHVVDATVLPSVPATTITLTVMANAHRIASEAAALD